MNKKVISGLIVGILLVAGALWYTAVGQKTQNQSPVKTEAQLFKEKYPKVAADNRFVFAKPDEIIDIIDGGDGVIFLGFPECPWCQQLAPIVDEAVKSEGSQKIYYLDIRDARANNNETYQRLVKELEDYLPKDDDGNPRISVPDVTAFRQGDVVGRFEQEDPAEGEEVSPDTYWTDERRSRALISLRKMVRQASRFAAVQDDVQGGALLIDVRTAEEFEAGHFESAINLDVEKIAEGEMPNVDKSTKLYVYCRSGNRSAQAASLLKGAGFTDVIDLGGLSDVEGMGGELTK